MQKKEFVDINTFRLRKGMEDIEADARTLKVFSSKLGQQSKASDSFFRRVCMEIVKKSPEGITFMAMQTFDTENQNCKIECGLGWDTVLWPIL